MLFGAHVSTAGGVDKAPQRAKEEGCEVFQMFSRPPQSYKVPELTDQMISAFKENMEKFDQKEAYIHTPYLINLASTNARIRNSSITMIKQELERGSKLGVKYAMTHLGSYKDVDEELEGPLMVVDALKKILNDDYETELLLEISAGAGSIVGDTFEELAYFIDELSGYKVGICLDTAHMFASGYDLRTEESVKRVFDDFDRIVGLGHLKLFHLNDSKVDINKKKDRHANLGDGYIGINGIKAILSESRLKDINFILETPGDRTNDFNVVKEIRSKIY